MKISVHVIKGQTFLTTNSYLALSGKLRMFLLETAIHKGPAKRIQHVDATSSNIVESNMLHSFGHHVARCCMMLHDVERSLISIKHRLQHHPTFLLFLSVNKNVAFVWPPCSTLLNARMPAKLTAGICFHGNI